MIVITEVSKNKFSYCVVKAASLYSLQRLLLMECWGIQSSFEVTHHGARSQASLQKCCLLCLLQGCSKKWISGIVSPQMKVEKGTNSISRM